MRDTGLRFKITAPFTVRGADARWQVTADVSDKNSFGVAACREFQPVGVDASSPDVKKKARQFRQEFDARIAKLEKARTALSEALSGCITPVLRQARQEARELFKSGGRYGSVDSMLRAGPGLGKKLEETANSWAQSKGRGTASQFRAFDLVELTRNSPFYFHGKEIRIGQPGERFSVVQTRADEKRVYLLTNDAAGKLIAIATDEAALRVVKSGEREVALKLRVLVADGKIPPVLTYLAQVTQSRPDLAWCKEMLETGQQILEFEKRAADSRLSATAAHIEAVRATRNAQVTDRPNPLIPGDTSNSRRADEMRAKAMKLEADAERHKSEAASLETQAANLRASFNLLPTR